MEIFSGHSGATNSAACGQISNSSELSCMLMLPCKYEKDRMKNGFEPEDHWSCKRSPYICV